MPRDVRAVIVHYHLFKTAGTSFARTLRENLGPAYAPLEAGRGKPLPTGRLRPDELAEYLLSEPAVRAVSSHTLAMPPPRIPGVVLLPVVFVRHPIDRVRSVYDFERQQPQRTPGSERARTMTVGEFVEWRLGLAAAGGDRSFASFQVFRLAEGRARGSELEAALEVIKGRVLTGVVEAYEASLRRIGIALRPWFPDLDLATFHDNRTASPVSLEQRIERLRSDLGEALFADLERANEDDLRLWRTALEQLARYEALAGDAVVAHLQTGYPSVSKSPR